MSQFFRQYVDFVRDHLWLLTAAMAIVTGTAIYLASSIGLDSNLQRLLPDDAPSVRGLEELSEAYGGQLGRLTIVLSTDEPESKAKLVNAARKLAPDVRQIDSVRRIEWQKPLDFFDQYRTLYVNHDDLQTIQKRIEKRIKWEKQRTNPLFVDVSDKGPPSVDFSDITEKYDQMDQSRYYLDEKDSRLLIFIYPTFSASKLKRSQALISKLNERLESRLPEISDSLSFELTGRYMKRIVLQDMLKTDLSRATALALILIASFLLFVLNSLVGTMLVVAPLIVGTLWAIGWAQMIFGSLNILTGFLGAVLFGLGVDYGIHLYLRFRELSREHNVRDALSQAFQTTGKANLFAGLTTIVALGSLAISEFRAFYEFGIISIGGMAFILLSYAVLFPALIYLLNPSRLLEKRPKTIDWTTSISQYIQQHGLSIGGGRQQTRLKQLGMSLGVLGLICVVGLPQVDFNRSFKVLESVASRTWELDRMVNDILGHSQTPSVVLTDSTEQSKKVVDEIEKRKKNNKDQYEKLIQGVMSLAEVLPQRQSDKLKILRELETKLKDVPKDARSDKLKDFLDEIKTVLADAPLQKSQLPASLAEPLERKDDPDKSVVLVFPNFLLSNTEKVDDYIELLTDLPIDNPPNRYDAISDAMLMYDIIRFVERDTAYMLAITLIGLMLLSWIAFKNWRYLALQTGLVVFAGLCGAAVLGLFGISFNFLNTIVLPIWLGLGVDASFHILVHLREETEAIRTHISTALAIAAAFLTSMLGFGSLLLSQHQGLFTLGQAAVVGLGVILVTNLLAQFFLFGLEKATETKIF